LAIVSAYGHQVGGVETYLGRLVPALVQRGHAVAFWHEVALDAQSAAIPMPADIPVWCANSQGPEAALASLKAWQPDVLFAHGLCDAGLEGRSLEAAPAVFFAHGYRGLCISGSKLHKLPVKIPCQRRFGWACLLHYYPRRCGGWNPISMSKAYHLQAVGRRLLGRYSFIATHSEHVRREYLRLGFASDRVVACSFFVDRPPEADAAHPRQLPDTGPCRVLFLGRMTTLKGGQVLLDALPMVQHGAGRPLRATFAGDGPERTRWQARAADLQRRHPLLSVEFTGWLDAQKRNALLMQTDLLIVPSLWPEPFGQVGLEAGHFGVPAAAFAVGGIPEWLNDGVNGHLASADPPTARSLATAVIRSLADPNHYAKLSAGALLAAQRFSETAHLDKLVALFSRALHGHSFDAPAP
jgi:glycosyltransferase involved in cell wall biosynthesis